MTLILSFMLFGAALAATALVIAGTLVPAMPRIISLLTSGTDIAAPVLAPAVRHGRARPITRSQGSMTGVALRAAA